MQQSPHRYLVIWKSSVTGTHRTTFADGQRATAFLHDKQARAYVTGGVVIDLTAHRRTPASFADHHHRAHDLA